ncbi:MAG: hypothetical protein U0031_18870 [Thermomicrobiales bacterium]
MNTLALILVLLTLALFLRVWTPWGANPTGNLVHRQPLSLYGRLRMNALPGALLIGAALLAAFANLVAPWLPIVVAALVAVLLALPFHYTLTAHGIQAGQTGFRRWTEFGGVSRRRGGVRLQGVAGARPMTVWLSGGREDDDFVLLLRQLVRGSYQGRTAAEIPLIGATARTIQIVGVGGS